MVIRPFRSLVAMIGGEGAKTEAILRVEPASLPFFSKNSSANNEDRREENRVFLITQIHLLRSKDVLARAVTNPNVSNLPSIRQSSDPIAWLGEKLRVEQIPDTFLIRVGFDVGDAEESYKFLQSIIHSYMDKVNNYGQATRNARIKQLESVTSKLESEIASTREKLRRICREGNHDEPDAGRRGEYRAHLRQEILRISLRLAAARSQGDRVNAGQVEKSTKPPEAFAESLEIPEAQQKVLESEYSRSANAEWECRESTRKLERIQSVLDKVHDQLLEAHMQAETGQFRVSIDDPPRVRGSKP
jgi:hypothetical protein